MDICMEMEKGYLHCAVRFNTFVKVVSLGYWVKGTEYTHSSEPFFTQVNLFLEKLF